MSSEQGGLSIRDVTVTFAGQPAVDALDLEVLEGTILAVLGPSGCGKSTLLRAVGGLLPLDAGSVSWGGRDLSAVPAHQRGFGLMFQDHALFSHRNVAENIEFGLRMQKRPKAECTRRVREILDLLDLQGFEKRDISTLSGGEAQRVALGRALAPEPRLLMLDEPLASLDRGLSERLAVELRAILTGLGITSLYVTHDQHEALAVAGQIAVMRTGQIVTTGDPREIREEPRTEETARFLGLTNIYSVTGHDQGRVATPWGSVPEPTSGMAQAKVLVRPEAVQISPGDAALVVSSTYRGELSEVVLDVGAGCELQALHREPLAPGSRWDFDIEAGGTSWIA